MLECDLVFFIRRILFDEVKKVEVSFGVSLRAFVVFKFEEAYTSVVVLEGFKLKHHASFNIDGEVFLLARLVGCLSLIVGQQAFISVRTLAVWTSGHLHLQNAHFDPKLDLFPSIDALYLANAELSGVVWPTVKKGLYVLAHWAYPSASGCEKAPDESGAPLILSVQ